ncbi:pyridoxal 5'-phosphate synthase glutaminase subunit PdxT [Candidatus Peregrinibacteria bacterium]|jgi:pyridoxal 5'-phosphate synthase pdxT subunit|nr:pyridoxal 5'-phosphate synthase glutaminase subunit PdxT [Candidatus Peregrinibacteria bacterium]MBT4055846.1 pyridoxal 5'-phosphate synthase glutaminase subunit PdxT [Candidatus Peregrinibacteria bacterium]
MKIGILDIQGSVEEHFEALRKLRGVEVSLVKNLGGLEKLDGLVIPGGESTTLSKLIEKFGLGKGIQGVIKRGGVVYGTCAGAILIGKKVFGEGGVAKVDEKVKPLGLIDIDVSRNAYGRQLDSFEAEVEVFLKGGAAKVPGVFIRAPIISRIGNGVEVLADYEGEPVLVRQEVPGGGVVVAGTFHPELTEDLRVYEEIFLGYSVTRI